MANEWSLWAAIVAIVEDDTGVGGIVTMMGKTHPLVQWGDSGMNTYPIITGLLGTRRHLSPTEKRDMVPVTFDVFVPDGTGDLAIRVLDRIEARMTNVTLAAEGVDVAVFRRERRSLPQLAPGQREAVDIDFLMTR